MGCGIYAIENLVTRQRYIGSSVHLAHRFGQHKGALQQGRHPASRLQAAWYQYGEAAFAFRLLLRCSPTDVLLFEQMAIDMLKPEYNVKTVVGCPPPSFGKSTSMETRARIAKALTGRKLSDEHRRTISEAQRGKRLTPEHRAHIGIGIRAAVARPGVRERMGEGQRGRKHTAQTKDKLRDRQKGKRQSLGAIEKMRQANIGKRLTNEHRKAIGASLRAYHQARRGNA